MLQSVIPTLASMSLRVASCQSIRLSRKLGVCSVVTAVNGWQLCYFRFVHLPCVRSGAVYATQAATPGQVRESAQTGHQSADTTDATLAMEGPEVYGDLSACALVLANNTMRLAIVTTGSSGMSDCSTSIYCSLCLRVDHNDLSLNPYSEVLL